ncbi:MAG: hypothetical protein K1X79_00650 [Oligoflexia bacterium]|nr:hypothetical protein [Oligoflexia bacterium]
MELSTSTFARLGLTENEARVYLALVELGMAGAALLTRRCGLPRTTVYSVLDALMRMGLVATEHSKGRTMFCANGPEALVDMVQREQEQLREKARFASDLAARIEPYFRRTNLNIPKIEFWEGEKNVRSMLFSRLSAWEQSCSISDKTFWGFQDHTFVEHYRSWLDHHWSRKDKSYPELQIKIFSNEAEVEKRLKGRISNRQVRNMPSLGEFDTTFWAGGDFVVLIFSRERPHYAAEIRDARLAANLRLVFKFLWDLTSPGKAQRS